VWLLLQYFLAIYFSKIFKIIDFMTKQFLLSTFLMLSSIALSAQTTDKLEFKKGFWNSSYYLNDKKISSAQAGSLLANNADAYKAFSTAKTNLNLANLTSFSGGFLVGYELGSYISGANINTNRALFGGGLTLLSFIFQTTSTTKFQEAALKYNQSVGYKGDKYPSISLGLVHNEKVGFLITF
jgi:hypothetical protein